MEAIDLYPERPEELYDRITGALKNINNFLATNSQALISGFDALGTVIPQITHLNDSLIYVMTDFRNTVRNIDVDSIPSLPKMFNFVQHVEGFLDAAQELLPEQSESLTDVRRTTRMMNVLSTIDEGKGSILALIDDIIRNLQALKH